MPNNIIHNDNFIDRIKSVIEKNTDVRSDQFLRSLEEFANKNKGLTEKQIKCFERIESHFSPQTIIKCDKWLKDFDDKKRQNLLICVEYYKNTPYNFDGLIQKIIADKTIVPTEEQYNKIVMNQYAQKVLMSTNDPPKFPKDTLVQIKKETGSVPVQLRGQMAFVLQPNSSPVKNAAKGTKRYKILPFGATQPIEVEERNLKYVKKGKKNEN